jgi:hypothetical protein
VYIVMSRLPIPRHWKMECCFSVPDACVTGRGGGGINKLKIYITYQDSDSRVAGVYVEKPSERPIKRPGLKTWQPS